MFICIILYNLYTWVDTWMDADAWGAGARQTVWAGKQARGMTTHDFGVCMHESHACKRLSSQLKLSEHGWGEGLGRETHMYIHIYIYVYTHTFTMYTSLSLSLSLSLSVYIYIYIYTHTHMYVLFSNGERCASRFSQWICHEQNENREQVRRLCALAAS